MGLKVLGLMLMEKIKFQDRNIDHSNLMPNHDIEVCMQDVQETHVIIRCIKSIDPLNIVKKVSEVS